MIVMLTRIEQYILPWFEQVSTEEGYRTKLRSVDNTKFAKDWLDAMENIEDKETLIRQNIVELKLPKKIQKMLC